MTFENSFVRDFFLFWLRIFHPKFFIRLLLYLCLIYGSIGLFWIFPQVLDSLPGDLAGWCYVLPGTFAYFPLLFWELIESCHSNSEFDVIRIRGAGFSFLVGVNWFFVIAWLQHPSFDPNGMVVGMLLFSIPWTIFGWIAGKKYWMLLIDRQVKAVTAHLALARFSLIYWGVFGGSLFLMQIVGC